MEKERKEVSEPLIATGSDGFLQVYVSAVANPGCFWVQVGRNVIFCSRHKLSKTWSLFLKIQPSEVIWAFDFFNLTVLNGSVTCLL